MLQGIEQIFENITEMITGLKRTTYQEKFETFQAEYGYYFEEMSAYMEETENHEAEAEAVGIRLMHAAEKNVVTDVVSWMEERDQNLVFLWYITYFLLY